MEDQSKVCSLWADRVEPRSHLEVAVGNRPLKAKTAKNTDKRQKKEKANAATNESPSADGKEGDGQIKERRLINGMELVLEKREDRESGDEEISPAPGEEPFLTDEEDDSLTLLRGRSDTN